jgi:kynurenine 3-monooxygenase
LNLLSDSTHEKLDVQSDLIFGCDGSYSVVRQYLMKDKPVEFSQTYNSGYYSELTIPAINGKFAMPSNHLHIWPRGEFMLIGKCRIIR